MSQQPVVEMVGLTKRYGTFTAVHPLDLNIREGEIFGLLGPNGAGKTTTILMMLGMTEPTAGKVRVFGCDPAREPLKVKRIVGYLPEKVGFYNDLTAAENLVYTARLNGIDHKEARRRIVSLLEAVGLKDVIDKPVGEFSRGMRQRLGIADVLVKRPQMVILDEPTQGIDPDGVKRILDLITRLSREQGITVLLTSHLLYQVQMICDRVGIFSKGRLVAVGQVEELAKATHPGEGMIIEVQASPSDARLVEALRGVDGVEQVSDTGDMLLVKCKQDLRPHIALAVVDSGSSLLSIRSRGHGLEEIYLKYFQ
ncbi:MAG: ABC transporter ATP-binding protein [Chloroflexota bacterium]